MNGENVPHLQVVELVLVHYNLVNNDYQQDSRILCAFAPKKNIWQFIRNLIKKSYLFKNT